MTIEQVRLLCLQIGESFGYDLDVPVVANGRLTTTLGRVVFQKKRGICTPVKIEFSKALLQEDDSKVLEIIGHEMAHFFVLKDTGKNHHHDRLWKDWARKLGVSPKARYEKALDESNYKYIVKCSSCGKTVGRYRKLSNVVKNPKNYKSTCCNSKIEVFMRK